MPMHEGPENVDFKRTTDTSWVSVNNELKCRQGVSASTPKPFLMTPGDMETLYPTSSPNF